MIIAIPVDETKENVCVSFGRAPYFLFHNSDTTVSEFVPNPAAKAAGGAGIKAAQLVADHNADALLTVRCGLNAAEVLQAADITIYKTSSTAVSDNISALADGKLPKLESFHAGFHGIL